MNRNVVYLALTIIAGCVAVACQGSDSAKATWVLIATTVEADTSPAPTPPEPDSDICENCNGRGKVGDGTVMRICPVCDGTGKKKKSGLMSSGWPPKDISFEASRMGQRKLLIYHSKNCQPCSALMAIVPELRRVGWDVEARLVADGIVPTTRVTVDGRTAEIQGYKGRSDYLSVLGSIAKQLRDQ